METREFRDYVGRADVPAKTFVDQIAERQKQKIAERQTSEKIIDLNTSYQDDPELSFVARMLFKALDYTAYFIPIVSVNLVLNILVRQQYSQDMDPQEILNDTVVTVPVIFLLYYLFHAYNATLPFKVASFASSVVIGCYLLFASNDQGYYAVMKRAPPLGTLWVWLFIEMEWHWAAVSLVVVAIYMKYKDYSL